MLATSLFANMISKYGFEDGEDVPVYAREARELIVKTINAVLEAKGSPVRAYAFDRAGMHNWCLIVFEGHDDEDPPLEVYDVLSAMDEYDLLDSLIGITVQLDPRADAAVAAWVGQYCARQ